MDDTDDTNSGEGDDEHNAIGSPSDGVSPDLPYHRVTAATYFERPSPSESKRPRMQSLPPMGMQQSSVGGQDHSQANAHLGQNQARNAPNVMSSRFARPPVLQTSLPYAVSYSRPMPTPLGGQPAPAMAPPQALYSPSFGHPGTSPPLLHAALPPAPGQGYSSQDAAYMNHFPTPLSSPFSQVSMTISPPAIYPGFSYFPASSPRMPGIQQQQQHQQHASSQQQEFANTFSPLGSRTFRLPPKKQ
jgi:hypothetical protein